MVTTKNKRNDFIFNLAIYDKKKQKNYFQENACRRNRMRLFTICRNNTCK